VTTDHEISHRRDITWTLRAKPARELIAQAWIGTGWIVEVAASGTRAGKSLKATLVSEQPEHHPKSPAATGAGPLEHRGLALDPRYPAL